LNTPVEPEVKIIEARSVGDIVRPGLPDVLVAKSLCLIRPEPF
jgi:hypothetical protein